MVRKMVLPAIFIFSALFIWPHQIVSGHSTQSILKDNAKFQIFIKIFLNKLTEKFSKTLEEDVEDVIETLQTALTSSTRHQKAANQKIVLSAIASIIADMLVEDIEDDMTIEERKAALRSALIQTYEEMGLEPDVLFIQEMENLVQIFQDKKEKDDDEGYETEETVRESVAVDSDINKAKVSVDVFVQFKTKLFVGLKAAGVLNLYVGKQFTKNQWYYLANVLVKKLDAKFDLNLGTSHVQSLFTALIGVNTAVDINLCLEVIADFTSQLLYEKGILVSDSFGDILPQCCEIVFLSLSDGLNIDTDISTALNLALGLNAKTQVDLKLGLKDGANSNSEVKKDKIFSLKDLDNLFIYYATNFGKALTSSDDFDLAILSGNKESVILAIASVLQSVVGEEVSTAFLSNSNM